MPRGRVLALWPDRPTAKSASATLNPVQPRSRNLPGDLRAVTLYELDDLVRIADQKNKHVILIARQCGACKRTCAEALRPLRPTRT